MMIVYPQSNRVMLLCAKNEGLNQGGTTEDTDFLDHGGNAWNAYQREVIRPTLP
jgi:hypothetical protein